MKYILLIVLVLIFSACAPAAIPDAPVQNIYVTVEQPLLINSHLNLAAYPESQITSWGEEGKKTRLWFVTPIQLPTIAIYFDNQFIGNGWIRENSHVNNNGSYASGRYSRFGEAVDFKLYIENGTFKFETW